MANKPLPGYETVWGNKKIAIIDHSGPNPYVAGGYSLTAAEFGWGGIEGVEGLNPGASTIAGVSLPVSTLSISGNYFITVQLATSAPSDAVATWTVKWFVSSTGVEVTTNSNTNLSTEKVRLRLTGV